MLDISKTYSSNTCGEFKVIDYTNCVTVKIKFINTGYITVATTQMIKKGQVKDYLHPTVFGIGFVGDGKHKATPNGRPSKAYHSWNSMLERCYCPKHKEKYPKHRDRTVTEAWHNFQNYASWFERNYKKGCHVFANATIRAKGVYSPNTCGFQEVKARHVKLTKKEKADIDFYELFNKNMPSARSRRRES